MVAHRMTSVLTKIDLSDVRQIVEIGSWHLGQSVEFANLFKEAIIDAFEPVPDSFALCKKIWSEQDDQKKQRIRVHNLAISDKEGEIPFYAIEPNISNQIDEGYSSMFKFLDVVTVDGVAAPLLQKEIMVKTIRLDSWCDENKVTAVDILWIDAQGAELLVLQGAEKILAQTKIIMTEVGLKPYYDGHTLKKDIDQLLEDSFEMNIPEYEANVIYVRNI